jgi:hypothetical protein
MKKNCSPGSTNDLWIAPGFKLKGNQTGQSSDPHIESPCGAHFLELADIAFGRSKTMSKKKKAANAAVGESPKT